MLNDALIQIRENFRLRIGLWLIVGILWLYGALELHDYLQAARNKHRAVAERVSRIQSRQSEVKWLTRVKPAKAMDTQLESRLWHASSPSLAKEIIEDWLRSTLTNTGATQTQISVVQIDEANQNEEESHILPQDLWKIRVNLSFGINQANITEMISKIEFSKRQLRVEMLNIRNNGMPHIDMQLIAYAQRNNPGDVKR